MKANKTTSWIGKHVPIAVSIFSNLQDDPIFFCKKNPELLIIAFVSSLKLLAEKSKQQMGTKSQEIENTVNNRVKKILNKLDDRTLTKIPVILQHEDECVEDGEVYGMSTQFLRIQKKMSYVKSTI